MSEFGTGVWSEVAATMSLYEENHNEDQFGKKAKFQESYKFQFVIPVVIGFLDTTLLLSRKVYFWWIFFIPIIL